MEVRLRIELRRFRFGRMSSECLPLPESETTCSPKPRNLTQAPRLSGMPKS